MPRATVPMDTVRKELKSLPEGFVVIRRMPYGKILDRRDSASRMSMDLANRKNQRVDMETMQRAARYYEFAHCIVEHNLTDDNDKPLNFSTPATLDILDPRIGAEIEKYIDEVNAEEDAEAEADFLSPSSVS